MRRLPLTCFLAAAVAILAGCGDAGPKSELQVDWPSEQKPQPPGRGERPKYRPQSCNTGKDDRALKAQASGRALISRLRRGPANPEADAATAARKGWFDLVWVVPLGGHHPVGMTCRAPTHSYISKAMNLELAHIYVSDVPRRPGEAPDPDDTRLTDYGRRYNLAMLRDRAFPYADLCREGRPDSFISVASVVRPEEWIGPRQPLTNHPRSLGEAARHGTPAALDRLIARDRARLNRPDDFGLTPLAWAVLHDRPQAVRRLLAAGANSAPPICGLHPAASPHALAVALKRPYARELAPKAD